MKTQVTTQVMELLTRAAAFANDEEIYRRAEYISTNLWQVEIRDKVLDMIYQHQDKNETISDVILRVFSEVKKQVN